MNISPNTRRNNCLHYAAYICIEVILLIEGINSNERYKSTELRKLEYNVPCYPPHKTIHVTRRILYQQGDFIGFRSLIMYTVNTQDDFWRRSSGGGEKCVILERNIDTCKR